MSLARTIYPEKPSDSWRGVQGQLDGDIHPPAGFVLPQPGDTVQCLVDYRTPALDKRIIIPAGAVGTVQECRMPDCNGHHGISMYFDAIAFVKDHTGRSIAAYPAGLVIPYDYAADPKIFSYGRSSSEYSL